MRLNAGIGVPDGWQFLPLKRIARFGYGDALASDAREQGGIKVYGSNGPFDEHSEANTLGPCIVVGRKGSYGKLNFSNAPVFAVDTTFIIDRRHTNADLRFLYYLLSVLGLDELSDDTAIPGLSREKAYQALSPLPPLNTQQRIAQFLDEKTAQIDGLIKKKRALLERLAEKRQALITRAVTKGLTNSPGANLNAEGGPKGEGKDSPSNPSTPATRDRSGHHPARRGDRGAVEGVGGMTPDIWETWKLSHAYTRIGSGTTPTTSNSRYYAESDGTPWVTTAELRENYITSTQQQVTPDAFDDFSALRIYQSGSVMMAMYGATIGRLGMTKVEASCNQACCVFEGSRQFDNRFLFYWLWHRRSDLIAQSVGGGQPNLSQQDLKEERALCPPLNTQQRIAQFLDEKTSEIDEVSEKIKCSINLLDEYRSALITAAVTGQISGLQ